jgi:outer membrane protein W
MRKTIFFTLFAMSSTLIAQKTNDKFTIEANLNFQTGSSPINLEIPAIRMRYFLNDNFAVRVLTGFTQFKQEYNIYDQGNFNNSGKVEQSSWNFDFAVGSEYHFPGTEKLSPYAGTQIGFQFLGASTVGNNTFNGYSYSANSKYENTISDGGGFNAGLVFGADYYIYKNVYIGGEISYGYSYIFQGYQESWNSQSNVKITTEQTTLSGFGLSANSGIRIGIRF